MTHHHDHHEGDHHEGDHRSVDDGPQGPSSGAAVPLNWEAIRTGLAQTGKERYWRGLEDWPKRPSLSTICAMSFPGSRRV